MWKWDNDPVTPTGKAGQCELGRLERHVRWTHQQNICLIILMMRRPSYHARACHGKVDRERCTDVRQLGALGWSHRRV